MLAVQVYVNSSQTLLISVTMPGPCSDKYISKWVFYIVGVPNSCSSINYEGA